MNQNPPTALMAENQEALDSGLDLGEAGQDKSPDRVYTDEDMHARHEKMATTNTTLVEKMLTEAESRGIVTEAWADAYKLPNRETNLRDLRKNLEVVTGKLNAKSFDEKEETETQLREQRAILVTEILYTITALLKTELGKYANKINTTLTTGDQTAAQEQISNLRYFEPQWTVLTNNSEQVLTHYRTEFSEVISNERLGELNSSLYLGINLSDNDLPGQELLAKGGTLVEIMRQVEKWLKVMANTQSDVLTPAPVEALAVKPATQPNKEKTADPSLAPLTVEVPLPVQPETTSVPPTTANPGDAITANREQEEDPNAPPKPPVLP